MQVRKHTWLQDFAFLGGCEATLVARGERNVLAVSYKGANSGDMFFHQQSWDPVFVADLDPQANHDVPALLSG